MLPLCMYVCMRGFPQRCAFSLVVEFGGWCVCVWGGVCELDGWRWELARVELCYDTWRLGSVQIAMGRGMGVFQMYVCMYVYV